MIRWLTAEPWPPWYRSMTLMFQREVAERLAAPVGGKAYGRLAVLAQWRADVVKLFDIDRRAFTPAPKVTSSLVRLTPRPEPQPGCRMRDLERVTAAAFGPEAQDAALEPENRSSLILLALLGKPPGIEETERAEQVDVAGFCRLAACLEAMERGKD